MKSVKTKKKAAKVKGRPVKPRVRFDGSASITTMGAVQQPQQAAPGTAWSIDADVATKAKTTTKTKSPKKAAVKFTDAFITYAVPSTMTPNDFGESRNE